MIRISAAQDIPNIAAIYDALLESGQASAMTGWQKGVYPVAQTAQQAHDKGELFVMEQDDLLVAAAIINQTQVDVYADCNWKFAATQDEVMVLHTLVVDPAQSGKGYATQFVTFYEQHARRCGCRVLRMDTNEKNTAARTLYQKLGYREAGIVPCVFNGIEGVKLVCLEKKISDN